MSKSARVVSALVTFNNGIKCPILGFGTWKLYGDNAYAAVKSALEVGYRHIDTAFCYENEDQVGKAINEKIKEGSIARKDIFVVSKLSSANHAQSVVVPALKKTLENLGLDYLDLFLIHFPSSTKPVVEGEVCLESQKGPDGNELFADIDPVETWKGMEECVQLGLAKCIGLSNFNSRQVQRILDNCTIKPATNQVECHHLLSQAKLQKFLEDNGIVLTAYRSLGGAKNVDKFLGNETLVGIGRKHRKTSAQVILRWLLQRGMIALPKSSSPERIKQNFEIFDFDISTEDMDAINAMNSNTRFCQFLDVMPSKYFPFPEDVEF